MALFTILGEGHPPPHLERHIIPSMVWLSFFVHCAPLRIAVHICCVRGQRPSGAAAGRGRASGLPGRSEGIRRAPEALREASEPPVWPVALLQAWPNNCDGFATCFTDHTQGRLGQALRRPLLALTRAHDYGDDRLYPDLHGDHL